MFFVYQFAVTAIIADPPGVADQQIEKIQYYLSDGISFIAHMAAAHPNEFITAVATSVVAAFTYVLAKSTTRLWQTTKDAAAAQARDMKASVVAAEANAEALINSQRGHLWVSWINVRDILQINQTGVAITLQIANVGPTPSIVQSAILTVRTVDLRHQDQWPQRPDPQDRSPGNNVTFCPPNSTTVLEIPQRVILALSEADLQIVRAGHGALLLYGIIEFRDAFGNEAEAGFAYVTDFTPEGEQRRCLPYRWAEFWRQSVRQRAAAEVQSQSS